MYASRFNHQPEHVDVALLAEIIAGLENCERDMLARTPENRKKWMTANLDALATNLESTRFHQQQIAEALAMGTPRERKDLAVLLAADLGLLLTWEQEQIIRGAQRPARLFHAAQQFRVLAKHTRAIGQLTRGETEAIAGMDSFAERFEREHAALLEMRAEVGAGLLRLALNREAASVDEVYQQRVAGKPRDRVELALVRSVLYRGCSIAIQAADLANAYDSPANQDARVRLRDKAFFYEEEELAVAERNVQ